MPPPTCSAPGAAERSRESDDVGPGICACAPHAGLIMLRLSCGHKAEPLDDRRGDRRIWRRGDRECRRPHAQPQGPRSDRASLTMSSRVLVPARRMPGSSCYACRASIRPSLRTIGGEIGVSGGEGLEWRRGDRECSWPPAQPQGPRHLAAPCIPNRPARRAQPRPGRAALDRDQYIEWARHEALPGARHSSSEALHLRITSTVG